MFFSEYYDAGGLEKRVTAGALEITTLGTNR